MRPVWFIVCFTVGVSLMVFSGYLPQSASASGNRRGFGIAHGASKADREAYTRSLTRRAASDRAFDADGDSAWEPEPEPAAVEPPEEPQDSVDKEVAADPIAVPPVAPKPLADAAEAPPPPVSDAPDDAVPPPTAETPPGPEVWPLLADASADRVVWMGWDELALDGSASTGQGITYEWKQTAGPVPLTVRAPRSAVTTAAGLLKVERIDWRGATYEFELTVIDATGERDTDVVRYVVKTAPSMTIKPMAERHFDLRDGYELGHFVAWTTNVDSYESVFDIASETELTFTKVAGSAYNLTGGKVGSVFTYQIVVYGGPGVPTSWVELLVDTDEKVPGIVQLGVNWEPR